MKNKTKKILTGACLGLVGMGCLAGCSMNEEQQATLNKVVDKADEVLSLVEKQNKELTFSEAVRLYEFAETKLLVNLDNSWDNLRIKIHQETTEDILEIGNVMDCEYHLFKKGDGRRVAYYSYFTQSDKLQQESSEVGGYIDDSESSSDYIKEGYVYVSDMLDFGEVKEENIVSVKINENNNYVISLVADIDLYSNVLYDGSLSSGELNCPVLVVCEISLEGQMISKRYVSIVDENAAYEYKDSVKYQEFDVKLTYEYNTLTEGEVQANITKINS